MAQKFVLALCLLIFTQSWASFECLRSGCPPNSFQEPTESNHTAGEMWYIRTVGTGHVLIPFSSSNILLTTANGPVTSFCKCYVQDYPHVRFDIYGTGMFDSGSIGLHTRRALIIQGSSFSAGIMAIGDKDTGQNATWFDLSDRMGGWFRYFGYQGKQVLSQQALEICEKSDGGIYCVGGMTIDVRSTSCNKTTFLSLNESLPPGGPAALNQEYTLEEFWRQNFKACRSGVKNPYAVITHALVAFVSSIVQSTGSSILTSANGESNAKDPLFVAALEPMLNLARECPNFGKLAAGEIMEEHYSPSVVQNVPDFTNVKEYVALGGTLHGKWPATQGLILRTDTGILATKFEFMGVVVSASSSEISRGHLHPGRIRPSNTYPFGLNALASAEELDLGEHVLRYMYDNKNTSSCWYKQQTSGSPKMTINHYDGKYSKDPKIIAFENSPAIKTRRFEYETSAFETLPHKPGNTTLNLEKDGCFQKLLADVTYFGPDVSNQMAIDWFQECLNNALNPEKVCKIKTQSWHKYGGCQDRHLRQDDKLEMGGIFSTYTSLILISSAIIFGSVFSYAGFLTFGRFMQQMLELAQAKKQRRNREFQKNGGHIDEISFQMSNPIEEQSMQKEQKKLLIQFSCLICLAVYFSSYTSIYSVSFAPLDSIHILPDVSEKISLTVNSIATFCNFLVSVILTITPLMFLLKIYNEKKISKSALAMSTMRKYQAVNRFEMSKTGQSQNSTSSFSSDSKSSSLEEEKNDDNEDADINLDAISSPQNHVVTLQSDIQVPISKRATLIQKVKLYLLHYTIFFPFAIGTLSIIPLITCIVSSTFSAMPIVTDFHPIDFFMSFIIMFLGMWLTLDLLVRQTDWPRYLVIIILPTAVIASTKFMFWHAKFTYSPQTMIENSSVDILIVVAIFWCITILSFGLTFFQLESSSGISTEYHRIVIKREQKKNKTLVVQNSKLATDLQAREADCNNLSSSLLSYQSAENIFWDEQKDHPFSSGIFKDFARICELKHLLSVNEVEISRQEQNNLGDAGCRTSILTLLKKEIPENPILLWQLHDLARSRHCEESTLFLAQYYFELCPKFSETTRNTMQERKIIIRIFDNFISKNKAENQINLPDNIYSEISNKLFSSELDLANIYVNASENILKLLLDNLLDEWATKRGGWKSFFAYTHLLVTKTTKLKARLKKHTVLVPERFAIPGTVDDDTTNHERKLTAKF